MHSLPTLYSGITFRSRLEARWAVFFDSLSIGYRYEPEGFNLDGGDLYLPDFYLPRLDCWIEIKPVKPEAAAVRKMNKLAWHTQKTSFIVYGNLLPWWSNDEDGAQAIMFWPHERGCDEDQPYAWCECPCGDRVGLTFSGKPDRLGCGCTDTTPWRWPAPRLPAAFEAARGARF